MNFKGSWKFVLSAFVAVALTVVVALSMVKISDLEVQNQELNELVEHMETRVDKLYDDVEILKSTDETYYTVLNEQLVVNESLKSMIDTIAEYLDLI